MNVNKCTNKLNESKENNLVHHQVILCHFMAAINRDLLEQFRSDGDGTDQIRAKVTFLREPECSLGFR